MTDVTSDTEAEKAPASGTSAVDDGLGGFVWISRSLIRVCR